MEGAEKIADRVVKVLSTLQELLKIVKALEAARVDLFSSLAKAIIKELESVINSVYSTGMYMVAVTPFTVQTTKKSRKAIISEKDDAKTRYSAIRQLKVELVSNQEVAGIKSSGLNIAKIKNTKFDLLGIPYLTPVQALNLIVAAFDDPGDKNRPVFGSSSQVGGFGFMISAPSIDALVPLMEAFLAVFYVGEVDIALKKIKTKRTQKSAVASTLPDFQTFRVGSIPQMQNLRVELISMLEVFRGYVGGLDTVGDLVDLFSKKVSVLKSTAIKIRRLLDVLSKSAAGLWVIKIPPSTGGNKYLKQQLNDAVALRKLTQNKYTCMVVFVGGGPNIKPLLDLVT